MDYEEYEKQCEEIKNQNNELLELFQSDMQGMSPVTIRRHMNNVEFFLNEYLLYQEPQTFETGMERLDDYLGYFFIRKCMWSTPASIKSTAASIKKFYKCMLNHGKIEEDDYHAMCIDIKYGLEDWMSTCEQYNDPEQRNPFSWF